MPSNFNHRWAEEMRAARNARGLTLRQLGKLTTYSHTYLWELETGRKQPRPCVAERIDHALQAGGKLLSLLATDDGPATRDDLDHLAHVTAKPQTLDRAAVDSLRAILAQQRRLEDSIGCMPLVAPTVVQLHVIDGFLNAAREAVRPAVLDVAAQWAQFAGWLHAAAGHAVPARDWYGRALEWATEVGNSDMIATALSMRGHLAWQARQPGPVIGLSAAALRQPASAGVRALAAQQQARGHALAGEADQVDRQLDLAADLAAAAADDPDREPPWIYFYSGDYLAIQRGLAYRLLGRRERAIDQLTAGLSAMRPEVRQSEWVGTYVLHLAHEYQAAGDHDQAVKALEEARTIAGTTGSKRLARQVDRLAERIGV